MPTTVTMAETRHRIFKHGIKEWIAAQRAAIDAAGPTPDRTGCEALLLSLEEHMDYLETIT